MEDLKLYIGLVGNVVSVLVFASPVKTFWWIVKNRSTGDFESIPYVCTLLSSLMWTYYGVTKPGGLLVATVNTVGIVLEAIYVTLFLLYAPPSIRARTMALAAILDVGFFGGVVLVTRLAVHSGARVTVIGGICTCLSMCMYGSPLAAMKTVITTKSVEYMPFLLSFFLFLNGGVWTAYAVLTQDVFIGQQQVHHFNLDALHVVEASNMHQNDLKRTIIERKKIRRAQIRQTSFPTLFYAIFQVPNGIGFILGSTQLVLYALYMNSKVPKQMSRVVEDEQRKCLVEPIEA